MLADPDQEKVFKKNIEKSQFSDLLLTVQHIAIRQTEQGGDLFPSHVIEEQNPVDKEPDNLHQEAEEDGAEEKSDNSADEVPGPSQSGLPVNQKKAKVLLAVLSPDGLNLAIACPDNQVAVFSLIANPQTSRYLFDPTYRLLSRQSDNTKIVSLCWSLVRSAYQNSLLLLVATADLRITAWVCGSQQASICKTISTLDVVTCMEFNPFSAEKTQFAVGTFDNYLRIYDIVRGNPVEAISTSDTPTCICFRDNKSIIVGMLHGTCRIYIYEGKYR